MCRYLSWIMKSSQGEIWKGTSSRYRQIDVPLYRSPPSHAPAATTQEIRKRDRGRAKGSRVRGVLCTIKQTEREEREREMTEYEKMLRGEVYYAADQELKDMLNRCKDLCWEYNHLRPSLLKERNRKLQEILGSCDEDTFINQPFLCDFGKHIRVGRHFFANFNLVVLDEALVTIGDHCFIGPNVSIYTACHSIIPQERNTRDEWARPVTIGNNVWIGGSVTILPGVTIGDNVTIGAGSVVVKDIPSDSLAVGNPARVVKHIPVKGQ